MRGVARGGVLVALGVCALAALTAAPTAWAKTQVTVEGGRMIVRDGVLGSGPNNMGIFRTASGYEVIETLQPLQTVTSSGCTVSGTVAACVGVTSVEVYLDAGNDNLDVTDEGAGAVSIPVVIFGDAGNDTLAGGAGSDTILGGEGSDIVDGDGGDDVLVDAVSLFPNEMGDRQDVYDGGAGIDVIREQSTEPRAVNPVQAVRISLDGVANDGFFTGSPTEDDNVLTTVENIESVGVGNDQIVGSADTNVISGGAGNDTISAGDGDDVILGGDGNDVLDGGTGVDEVYGDAGDDTSRGGAVPCLGPFACLIRFPSFDTFYGGGGSTRSTTAPTRRR